MLTAKQAADALPVEADFMLPEAMPAPFDWVREGTSYWVFDDKGDFAIPRVGVEAEPHRWDTRRYQANFGFADGRVLSAFASGACPPVRDARGRPAVMGGGPVNFTCIEPFEKWLVTFDGEVKQTHVKEQIAKSENPGRKTHLKYAFEARPAAPANVQDISPEKFFTWGKGKQRDAASVGLGWRFDQLMIVAGEYSFEGVTRSFTATANRVKRRSVRTDGLFLRGHVWQAALFPDGRGFAMEVRPRHPEGFEPWNEAFLYLDGKVHRGHVVKAPFLGEIVETGEDVSLEIETDLGVTKIGGKSTITTFRLASGVLWGLSLSQSAAQYSWDGQVGYGMIERSSVPA